MKTIVLAAAAALGLATSAVAGGSVEPQPRPVIVDALAPATPAFAVIATGAMPFDHSADLSDNWSLRKPNDEASSCMPDRAQLQTAAPVHTHQPRLVDWFQGTA